MNNDNDHLANEKTLNLIKAYEKLHKIPEKDCVTDSNDEKFALRYADALAAIFRSSEAFQNNSRFDNGQEVLDFMRKCLLHSALNEGDMVVCVPFQPFNDDGSTYYTYEKIKWMDSSDLCGVELMGEERWIPLSYVLARFNADANPLGAFHMPNAELMFLDNEDEAMPLLLKAQNQLDGIAHSLSVVSKAFAEKGLNPDNGMPLAKKQKSGKDNSKGKPKLAERLEKGKRKAAEQDNSTKKSSSKRKKKEARE